MQQHLNKSFRTIELLIISLQNYYYIKDMTNIHVISKGHENHQYQSSISNSIDSHFISTDTTDIVVFLSRTKNLECIKETSKSLEQEDGGGFLNTFFNFKICCFKQDFNRHPRHDKLKYHRIQQMILILKQYLTLVLLNCHCHLELILYYYIRKIASLLIFISLQQHNKVNIKTHE